MAEELRAVVMTWPPQTSTLAVVAMITAACFCDLRRGRVPNALTFGAAAIAVALHSAIGGWSGLLLALGGWVVGFALFAPLYALKGMGAGDVKLLAAIGSWLGPVGAVWTALFGAIAGGVLALVVILVHGRAMQTMSNIGTILRTWHVAGAQPVPGLTLGDVASARLPYALPIAVGAMVTLWIY
jgi:prepilin peptidase CpaA